MRKSHCRRFVVSSATHSLLPQSLLPLLVRSRDSVRESDAFGVGLSYYVESRTRYNTARQIGAIKPLSFGLTKGCTRHNWFTFRHLACSLSLCFPYHPRFDSLIQIRAVGREKLGARQRKRNKNGNGREMNRGW